MSNLFDFTPAFEQPALLLSVAIAGGALSALATWIGAPGWGMARRVLVILVATLLATVIGAALARPFTSESRQRAVRRIIVLDASPSHRAAERAAAMQALRTLESSAEPGDAVLLYGNGLEVARCRSAGALPRDLLSRFLSTDAVPGEDTGAADAAGMIGALEDPDHDLEVIWLTDGRGEAPPQSTAPAWRKAGRELSVWIDGDSLTDAQPLLLEVPERVHEGTPFDIRLTIAKTDGQPAEMQLAIALADQPAAEPTLLFQGELAPSKAHRFGPLQLPQGNYLVSARHVGTDAIPDNDELIARVEITARPVALLVHGRAVPGPDDVLRLALDTQSFDVRIISTPSAQDLLAADLVVLDDVSPEQLHPAFPQALAQQVRERGTGLWFVAGERADNHTAWNRSALADILPLSFAAPTPPAAPEEKPGDDESEPDLDAEPEKVQGKVARVGLVLCIDRSGSMEGDKIEMAKAAAIKAAQSMQGEDELAVVAFDSRSYLALPFTPARECRQVASLLGGLQAGGSTSIFQALQYCHDLIKPRLGDFAVRHVILMTDGYSQTWGKYKTLLEQMVADRITVTTVGIGSDFDRELLGQICRTTGGRTETARDFHSLPLLIARDVAYHVQLLNRPPEKEGDEKEPKTDPSATDSPETADPTAKLADQGDPAAPDASEAAQSGGGDLTVVTLQSPPFLRSGAGKPLSFPSFVGIAASTPTGGSQFLLGAVKAETKAAGADGAPLEVVAPTPLLVASKAGRGRVLAWCSDLGGSWTRQWFHWTDFSLFVAQSARSLLPQTPPGSARLELTFAPAGEDAVKLHAMLFDSSRAAEGDTTWQVDVIGKDGTLNLEPRPDMQAGGIVVVAPLPVGALRAELRVTARRNGQVVAARTLPLQRQHFGDIEELTVREDDWRDFAQAAGGRVSPLPTKRHTGGSFTQSRDLTLWPLVASAVLLVLVALLRRR